MIRSDKKILIIKGPLVSTGRNTLKDNFDENIVDFDCINYLKYYLKFYRRIFNIIILCTWEDQKKYLKNLDKNIINQIDKIQFLEDNIEDKRERKFSFDYDKKNPLLLNNSQRAMRLLSYSLKDLKASKNDLIFVIRPDMKIDLNKALSQKVILQVRKNKIFIPCFTRSHAIHDLFFIFNFNNAKGFSSAFLNPISYTYNPHTDYSINFLNKITDSRLLKIIYSKLANFELGRALLLEISSFNFIPLDKEILSSSYWRGRKIRKEEIPHYYNFNQNNIYHFLLSFLKIFIKICFSIVINKKLSN